MKNFTKRIALLLLVVLGVGYAEASAQVVRGTVKDTSGQPIPGAVVYVDGTTIGVTVGIDGDFALDIKSPEAVLVASCVGYNTVNTPVKGGGTYNIVLAEDVTGLEEIVVVGYGVQKKSVVTAAISSISPEDLAKQSNTRIDNVLQGMTSGVVVTQSSGAPDAGSTVRIRGVGSINSSDPLYIVDGLAISGGIDYLNPNDIERIEVLKDAASGAIYGARATNGVILVTTKRGKAGQQATVNYDFSYGWQNPWRKPNVLNATEYATMINEGLINAGEQPRYADPYALGKGTDWVGAILNDNAPVMKHDLTISGGSDAVVYSLSAGYLSKEGIVGGNYNRSNYERMSLRSNISATIFDKSKSRNWLNKMTVSTSTSYSRILSRGISTNSEYGSPLGSAMGMAPTETIFADEATDAIYKETLGPVGQPGDKNYQPDYYSAIVRDKNGRPYTIVDGGVYNELKNPLAQLELPGTKYTTDKFISNFSAELQIFDGLKFKTSVGTDLAFWGNHGYWKDYYLSSKDISVTNVSQTISYDKDGNEVVTNKTNYKNGASQEMNRALLWQVENVLSYEKDFGKHHIAALIGQSAISSSSANVGASAKGLMYPYDPYKISVNNTYGKEADGDRNGWGSWNSVPYRLVSYFARASYNYDERYMVEATIRRDGSSRFGPSHKWGNFPSISVGWNIKNEKFMQDFDWLSSAKLRVSYGVNGNDNIGNFRYAVYMNSGNNAVFGSGALGTETIVNGAKPNGLANPDVKWEESHQTDIGLDVTFLKNRINFTVDYYMKKTKDMLYDLQVPAYAGDSAPIGNVATMKNSGVEFELGYRDSAGDFKWHVTANATYNKNKLTSLGDEQASLGGETHKIGQLSRGIVGLPFPYFYGYKVDGIFQNAAEVAAYVNADGDLLQPKAAAGDVRFVDFKNDGVIDDNDRTMIGKGMPDWVFGINLGFEWKGLDFNMLLQGQAGCQTFNVSRRTDLRYINLPKTILNRWTGEGSTNKYPRFMFDSANENYRPSEIWLEDASFLRARNVQIGYTLPAKWTMKAGISRLRVFVQAENLFTLTNYSGCDPEVTNGIDRGVYPQSRVFSVGANITF